jgi:hypothetical protein
MLGPCPECQHEVSTEAYSCPHCGLPLRRKPTDFEQLIDEALSPPERTNGALGCSLVLLALVGVLAVVVTVVG